VLTLSNGAVVKVTAVASGGVTAAAVQSLGTVTASASGLTVTSTTGTGSGAMFSLTIVNQIAFTSLYTGSLGNQTQVTFSAGSSSTPTNPSYRLTVAMPGVQEVFDNIAGAGAAVWSNLANAVNNGISSIRGPSRLLIATAGTSLAVPVLASFALAGGSDGATPITAGGTVNAATLVGQDIVPRKGLYALRTLGCSVAWLADADDSTQWANQVGFATSEFVYVIGTGPAGDTISNAVTTKQTAGIDSPWFKLLFGDWVYWQDSANNVLRLVSPQGFIGGLLGNLSPQNSTLNKPLFGVVGTQKTGPASNGNSAYAYADLQQLISIGLEVIANPCPGGSYFGAQSGHNSSSDATRNTDAYTRMTDYISTSLGAATGVFVGQLQTPQQQLNAKAAINAFFQSLQDAGQIGTATGAAAFKVTLDASNNPAARVALGYEQADIQVTYLNVVEKFLVNFQGGGSVQIASNQT
ncbi:MAG: phage tail protein, partial [Aliidongia sp.]